MTVFKLGSGVLRHGSTMPLLGALADLVAFGDIAGTADEAELYGVFVKRIVDAVFEQRGSLDGFDFACPAHPSIGTAPFVEAGATWLLNAFWPGNTSDQVLRFISRFNQR